MVSLVWRTDVHLADQPPQSRTDDWTETILGKLAQVGEIARQVKAQAVIDGGDFFHVKSPGRNTHRLTQKVAALHADYPCPVWGNVGNHDVKYGEMDYLSESPLGVLFESGVFRRLYDEHEALIEAGEVKVRIVGIPYHGVRYDMNRFSTLVKGDEDWLVVAVHCLASPSGGEMFEGEDILKYADLANLAPDVWLFGHWHKDQGVQKVGNSHIVNVGSLSRGALAQDELTRKPSVAVLNFTKKKVVIEQVFLDVAPAEDVFDVTGRIRAESREMTFDAFVSAVRETLVEKASKAPLAEAVAAVEEVPQKVRERAILYLEQAGV